MADLIFEQGRIDPPAEAARFVDPDKGVASIEEALAGARDIIAERASEDPQARSEVRRLFSEEGVLRSKASPTADGDGSKYRDYADWSEPLFWAPSHRVMAVLRGKKEGFLTLHAEPPAADALAILDRLFVRGKGPASEEVRLALQDGYRRLLAPALEREALSAAREKAEERAIGVFAENLRHLLLEPPLGERRSWPSIRGLGPAARSSSSIPWGLSRQRR